MKYPYITIFVQTVHEALELLQENASVKMTLLLSNSLRSFDIYRKQMNSQKYPV